MTSHVSTSSAERIKTLLGQGLGVDVVAAAIGVSPSLISQHLSDPVFSAQVAELRYSSLAKHNDRDTRYDEMEDALQEKLKDLIPYMMKPLEVLRAITVINSAKRRGISTPEQITGQQDVVKLTLPTQIINNFTQNNIEVNVHNQVIRAGDQTLVTVQSANMEKLLEARKSQNVQLLPTTS